MFHHATMLADLKQFMSDIFIEKQIMLLLLFTKLTISALYFNEYFYRSSAFKIPSRVTIMSDNTKRHTWFAELARLSRRAFIKKRATW